MQIVPSNLKDGSDEEGPSSPLLIAREVANLLRIPVKKAYELGLPHIRLSERRIRFLESDVRAYMRRRRVA